MNRACTTARQNTIWKAGEIDQGTENFDKWYAHAFREALKFVPLIKKTQNKIIEKTLPYDFRIGKIKGKYVLQKTINRTESRELLKHYEKHILQQAELGEISLEDYLNTVALCYTAAYGKETDGLTPEKMYWKWADKKTWRHAGS